MLDGLDHVEELTNRFLGPAWYRNNLSHSHATLSTLMTALRLAEVAMAVNTVPSLNATLDTFLWVQYCHLIPLMHSATTFLCRVRLRFGLDPTDRFWRCDAVPLTSYIIGSCTFQPFSTMRCSKSWQHIDRFLTIFDYEMFKKLAKHNRDRFFF